MVWKSDANALKPMDLCKVQLVLPRITIPTSHYGLTVIEEKVLEWCDSGSISFYVEILTTKATV